MGLGSLNSVSLAVQSKADEQRQIVARGLDPIERDAESRKRAVDAAESVVPSTQ